MSHNNNRLAFYKKTVPATFKAVSLSEVKSFIGLPETCSAPLNTKLNLLIDSVTECFERFASTVVMQATFQVKFDEFRNNLEIRRYPLVSITTVKYFDDATPSVEQTVSSDDYYIIEDAFYSLLAYANDFIQPSLRDREQSVIITFLAGFASESSKVPADIKTAIIEQVSFLYENSGCDPDKSMSPVFRSIINKYKPLELGGGCHG